MCTIVVTKGSITLYRCKLTGQIEEASSIHPSGKGSATDTTTTATATTTIQSTGGDAFWFCCAQTTKPENTQVFGL